MYTVRSPFCVGCEKIPLSQFVYTSAAIDAMDKYQVCSPFDPLDLKVDIEGHEVDVLPQWIESGALEKVV